jgi:hypothetical protein
VRRDVIRLRARYSTAVQAGTLVQKLDDLLETNARKLARERLTLTRVFEDLRGLGYEGGYDAVRRHAQMAGRARRADGWRPCHSPSKVRRRSQSWGGSYRCLEDVVSRFVPKASPCRQAENQCATYSDLGKQRKASPWTPTSLKARNASPPPPRCKRRRKAKIKLQQTSATIGVSG